MKRGWKIALGLLGALAVLLATNTITTNSQTKEAGVTAEGGEILELSRGAVQVTDTGEPVAAQGQTRRITGLRAAAGQPIVLLHCYACSLHWFDRIEPLLAERHRVIRIDLLGFGGSEKPESGYEIPAQAALVAEALNQLEVEGALVAGNSMGAMVATSLAEQASELVDRAVVIDMAPEADGYGPGLPFLAQLSYTPVLGHALWRLAPDFAVRSSYGRSFAPEFDAESGFDDPDQVIADFRAMTYTSFDSAPSGEDYLDELPLDERFKRTPVPLLVIFGAEDQIFDAQPSLEAYEDVPGARTELVEDAGHAPQVEQPEAVAGLVERFSVAVVTRAAPREQAGDRPGERSDRPAAKNRGQGKQKERDR